MIANMSTPVQASNLKSPRSRGSNGTRPTEIARRTTTAMMKRSATNEIGGRSRSPNLIASQVELQIMQSATKAAIAASLVLRSGIDYQAIRSRAAQLLSRLSYAPRQTLHRVRQRLESHQLNFRTIVEL